jgi:hypothetical protein
MSQEIAKVQSGALMQAEGVQRVSGRGIVRISLFLREADSGVVT